MQDNNLLFKPSNLWLLQQRKGTQIPIWFCNGIFKVSLFLQSGKNILLCPQIWEHPLSIFFMPWISISLIYSFTVSYYWWKSLQKFLPHSPRILLMMYWNNNKKDLFSDGVYSTFPGYHLILPLVHIYSAHLNNLNLPLLTKERSKICGKAMQITQHLK